MAIPGPIKTPQPSHRKQQQGKMRGGPAASQTPDYGVKRRIRRAGPSTPVPSWKLYDNPFYRCQTQSFTPTTEPLTVSARRLAATLWELQTPPNGLRTRKLRCVNLQCIDNAVNGNKALTKSTPRVKENSNGGRLDEVVACNGSFLENGSLVQTGLISSDDPARMDSSAILDELFRAYNRIQVLEEEQNASTLLVKSLRAELELACERRKQVEFEQKISRKEMDHLLKKIAEERTLWRSQKQERISAEIKPVKEELESERKSKRKVEIINRKLAKELAEAKMDILKFMQELENERKAREVMEDVCDELAKEIGEDKAKAEELRRESEKYRQEVEEERRMLQMAEVWREERCQMKLEAARLYLEAKHLDLEKLKSELEGFLESTRTFRGDDDVAYMRGTELLRNAANSTRIQDFKELSCQPSAADDVFSGDEDLHTIDINTEAMKARSTRDFLPNTPLRNSANSATNPLTVSPALQSTSVSPSPNYSKATITEDERRNEEEEEERDFATGEGSRGEGETSDSSQETEDGGERLSDSHRENMKPSGNEADENVLQTQTDEEDKVGSAISITEQEDSFDTRAQLRKENSPVRHFVKSSPCKGEFYKKSPMRDKFPSQTKYFSFSQHSVIHGTCSPDTNSARSTPDTGNPHIARGIKGFIEWPKGIRKNSLKAKLWEAKVEAKVESQKAQLRHVLKPKHMKTEISRS